MYRPVPRGNAELSTPKKIKLYNVILHVSSTKDQLKPWDKLLHLYKFFSHSFCLVLQRNCPTWENRWRHWKRKMSHTWKKPWIYKRYSWQGWLKIHCMHKWIQLNLSSVDTLGEENGCCRKVVIGSGFYWCQLG